MNVAALSLHPSLTHAPGAFATLAGIEASSSVRTSRTTTISSGTRWSVSPSGATTRRRFFFPVAPNFRARVPYASEEDVFLRSHVIVHTWPTLGTTTAAGVARVRSPGGLRNFERSGLLGMSRSSPGRQSTRCLLKNRRAWRRAASTISSAAAAETDAGCENSRSRHAPSTHPLQYPSLHPHTSESPSVCQKTPAPPGDSPPPPSPRRPRARQSARSLAERYATRHLAGRSFTRSLASGARSMAYERGRPVPCWYIAQTSPGFLEASASRWRRSSSSSGVSFAE